MVYFFYGASQPRYRHFLTYGIICFVSKDKLKKTIFETRALAEATPNRFAYADNMKPNNKDNTNKKYSPQHVAPPLHAPLTPPPPPPPPLPQHGNNSKKNDDNDASAKMLMEVANQPAILNETPSVEDKDLNVTKTTPPDPEFVKFDAQVSKHVHRTKPDGAFTKTIKKVKFHVPHKAPDVVDNIVVMKLKKYKMNRFKRTELKEQHYETLIRENGAARFRCSVIVVNTAHISRKDLSYPNLMTMPHYRESIERDFQTVHGGGTLSYGVTMTDPKEIIVICVQSISTPLVMYCEVITMDENHIAKYPTAPPHDAVETKKTSPYSILSSHDRRVHDNNQMRRKRTAQGQNANNALDDGRIRKNSGGRSTSTATNRKKLKNAAFQTMSVCSGPVLLLGVVLYDKMKKKKQGLRRWY